MAIFLTLYEVPGFLMLILSLRFSELKLVGS